jgi:hypothetical protein
MKVMRKDDFAWLNVPAEVAARRLLGWELVLLPENPRTITKNDFERLVDSIKINGFWKHRPLAVMERDGKLVVLAGNQRLKAARKLKLADMPVILYSELTPPDSRTFIPGAFASASLKLLLEFCSSFVSSATALNAERFKRLIPFETTTTSSSSVDCGVMVIFCLVLSPPVSFTGFSTVLIKMNASISIKPYSILLKNL